MTGYMLLVSVNEKIHFQSPNKGHGENIGSGNRPRSKQLNQFREVTKGTKI